MERLQKIIASRGVCSRRQAEEWIGQGRVSVNGVVARLGQTADPKTDAITIDGQPLPGEEKRVCLMLNKPRGYVTTLSDEKGRRNAAQLVADCGQRVYPVGRLDMDSEGLLLFTNDGDFANRMMHPRHETDKVYLTWVTGYSPENLQLLARPIELDGYCIRRPALKLVSAQEDRALICITIHEGRNHQIRRMCQAANMHVTRLKRIREGKLELGQLKTGQWRYLTDGEIRELME